MLTTLLSYLLLYKYAALFVFVFSIAVIVPLPANGILLAAGAFASFGYFNLPLSIVVSTIGSVAGDILDYSIARYYGRRVFEKFRINKHYYFERLEHGFRTHAGLTIFVTRFVGPIDLLGSLFSGSIGIPAGIFVLYDLLGNFVSTCIVVVIGYLAGSYWQNFSGLIDIAGWILLAAVVLFITLRTFLRRHRHSQHSHGSTK